MSGPADQGYIEVSERIQAFYAKYPEGSLQCGRWYTDTLGEQTYIIYQAFAYRHADDKLPGEGWAWEPFPGKTPFTRDSELQNAETSAWGRALAALGLEVRRGIATAEEVASAKAREPVQTNNAASATTPATKKQVPAAKRHLKESNLTPDAAKAIWVWGHTATREGERTLSRPAADAILDAKEPGELEALARQAGYIESDLPPPDDVVDETVEGDERIPF